MGATFTNEALLTQEDILQLHTDKLMEVLKKHSQEKKAIDFSSWCKHLCPKAQAHTLCRGDWLTLLVQSRTLRSM